MFAVDSDSKKAGGVLLTVVAVIFLFLTINLTTTIIALANFHEMDHMLEEVDKEQAMTQKWIIESNKLHEEINKQTLAAGELVIYQGAQPIPMTTSTIEIKLDTFFAKFDISKETGKKLDIIYSFEGYKLNRLTHGTGKYDFGVTSHLDYDNKKIVIKVKNAQFNAETVQYVGIGKKKK